MPLPVDHVGPRVLGNGIDLDRVVAVIAHVHERVGDEVDLVAVVPRVVAGRGVRTAREEQVREAGRLDPEERRGPSRPVVLERETVPAPNPHAQERAGPKSNPVAHTMMSKSRTPSVVSMPLSVRRTIGVSRRSTSETFGRLYASK